MESSKALGEGHRNWVWVCRVPGPKGVPTSEEHRWAWAAHMWLLETEEGLWLGLTG